MADRLTDRMFYWLTDSLADWHIACIKFHDPLAIKKPQKWAKDMITRAFFLDPKQNVRDLQKSDMKNNSLLLAKNTNDHFYTL